MSTDRSARAIMTLRDRVLSGALPPGERLFEVALAEDMGISRTPVRSALAALEQEGLLERQPGGGYAVRRFSFQDVADAIELRGVLEGTAARLAAERGVDAGRLAAIRRILAALDGAVDPQRYDFARYQALNAEFHETLSQMPGSAVLCDEIARAGRLPFASPSAFLQSQQAVPAFHRSLITAQAQHHAIVAAIAAREGARAEAVAREHARQARSNLEYVMFQDRSLIDQVPGLALLVE